MNYWHMQLHQGDPHKMSLDELKKIVETQSVIGMGDEWDNDGGAPAQFENEIKKGDIVVIRHLNNPRYIVEVVGDCEENKGNNFWFSIYRKIRVLSNEGEVYKKAYQKKTNKKWSDGIFAPKTFQTANNWNFAKFWYQQILERINMETSIKLLENNHNLILTGAPGTGKTYLAKQIAQQMIFGEVKEKMNDGEQKQFNEQCEFVQFHPSYDYTDFVEGLRPLDDGNGNVGFERKDGVFKEFCAKALDNLENSQKDESVLSKEFSVEKRYLWLLSQIENEEISEIPLKTNGKKLLVEKVSDFKNIILKAPNTTSSRTYTVSLKRILKLSKVYTDTKSLNAISNISVEVRNAIGGCNASAYWAVLNLLYKEQDSSSQTNALNNKVEKKDFVFIIDEINRGEINKIFGELFFSIDPGYRGKDGKVRTQYASMQEEPNDFDMALGVSEKCGNFFVPENVYIIGTMNDIDRSVESMDFAFRRRFAFKEVTAKETQTMLDSDDAWKDETGVSQKPENDVIDEIKARMNSLNAAIEEIEGLSSAYHIGASYFLKLANYKGKNDSYNFDELWIYHLEGLLREYLRGMPNAEDNIIKLHNAYNKGNSDNKSVDVTEK